MHMRDVERLVDGCWRKMIMVTLYVRLHHRHHNMVSMTCKRTVYMYTVSQKKFQFLNSL